LQQHWLKLQRRQRQQQQQQKRVLTAVLRCQHHHHHQQQQQQWLVAPVQRLNSWGVCLRQPLNRSRSSNRSSRHPFSPTCHLLGTWGLLQQQQQQQQQLRWQGMA
jgi:hypothetical protein